MSQRGRVNDELAVGGIRRRTAPVVSRRGTRDAHPWAADVLRLQRAAGNLAVRRLLAGGAGPGTLRIARAGTPQAKDPPEGFLEIKAMARGGLGSTMGLTRAYDAFIAPRLEITTTSEERGDRTRWYASIQPTTAADAVHDSWYPGPGPHRRMEMPTTIEGVEYTYIVNVSPRMSQLIRRGEQEHLNDHRRSYDLTYGAAARAINRLSRRRFGPASSEEDAREMAMRGARRALGRLGTDPAGWHERLVELLRRSRIRDERLWHSIGFGPLRQDSAAGTMTADAIRDRTTRVGSVPSSRIVRLQGRR